MPWSIERREGRYCVIKNSDGSSAGCHDSRTDAIKQQRALYANESRTAAMYAELDALPIEEIMTPAQEPKSNSELVKVVIGNDHDALTASMLDRLDAMSDKQAQTQQALVAALHAIGTREPLINVAAPNVDVNVEPPEVNVQPPAVTVEAPNVTVEAAKAPSVTVKSPENHIHLPSSQKTITFERDFDGRVTKADVVEGDVT